MVMQQCVFFGRGGGGGGGVNKVNCVVSKNIHTPHGGEVTSIMLVRFTNYAKVNCFWKKKILLFMLIQCVIIAILRWKGLS